MTVIERPHSLTPDEVARVLEVDPSKGLGSHEVVGRRQRYGANLLVREGGRPAWQLLLRQFSSIIVILLAVAAGVSFATAEYPEAFAIVAVLLINAAIGFFVEWQAERALGLLRLQGRVMARVRRDGVESMIDAEELVVGDTIVLDAGVHAPADARVVEAAGLQSEESSLTGESIPVSKSARALDPDTPLPERTSMIHLGTPVTSGRGVAIVTAVGEETELGRVGQLVRASIDEPTPLELQLSRLGHRLVQLVLVIAVVVVVGGVARGEPLFPMIEFGISLAVAAVPEGLQAVTTLILAIGVLRMARRHAIVRRLPAVETLGSTTVICTDKTGTLTQNRLTVRAVESPDAERVLAIASLCSDAVVERGEALGDPTEAAIVNAALERGIDVRALRDAHPKIAERPFDHESKRMITIHRAGNDGRVAALKGAPGVVLDACRTLLASDGREIPMTNAIRSGIEAKNDLFAAGALRVLGVAEQRGEHIADLSRDYVFLGLIAMADPPREAAAEAIARARAAGVRVVMLTGDQIGTARAIATELRLSGDSEPVVIHARELSQQASEEETLRVVRRTDVFARVSPADKLQIVAQLRASGEIVAVTGDGVNDAPALRRADIGVAMGRSGTDVARQSADLILTDDNLGTVVDAIEQGRTIFANIGKFVHLMFSHNLGEVLLVFAMVVSGLPLPLLPLQILWLNLATDIFPAFALAMEPPSPEATRRPSHPGAMLSRSFVVTVLWQGALLASIAATAYLVALSRYGAGDHARTIALSALVAVQVGHTFNCRSRVESAFAQPFSNAWVWASAATVISLQFAALNFEPLSRLLRLTKLEPPDLVLLAVALAVPVLVVESQKLLSRAWTSYEARRTTVQPNA